MSDDRAYSVQDLAERWGCSDDAVYKMINEGALHFFMIGKPVKKGKRKGIRIAAKEVLRWEGQGNENRPTPPAPGPSAGTARRLLRSAARAMTASG
jgi:excisionase family DNA binding protein